jgi:hypothetical protein
MNVEHKILDYRPASVNGPINRNRTRVIWNDGTLYVFSAKDEFLVYEDVPEPEIRSDARTYTTTVKVHAGEPEEHEQEIRWAISGCGTCGFSLGRITARHLLSGAKRQLAARRAEAEKETTDA